MDKFFEAIEKSCPLTKSPLEEVPGFKIHQGHRIVPLDALGQWLGVGESHEWQHIVSGACVVQHFTPDKLIRIVEGDTVYVSQEYAVMVAPKFQTPQARWLALWSSMVEYAYDQLAASEGKLFPAVLGQLKNVRSFLREYTLSDSEDAYFMDRFNQAINWLDFVTGSIAI